MLNYNTSYLSYCVFLNKLLYICGLKSLTLRFMAQKTIKIKVLTTDSSNIGSFKELYRNSIAVPDGVKFDYDLIERALLLLYPNTMVEFLVSAL